MSEICVSAPAKVNLTLEVGARRSDGYHEIVSLMLRAGPSDTIRLSRADGGEVRLRLSGPFAAEAGEGESNLAYRAAIELWRRWGRSDGPPPGLEIELEKQIPVAAGLGGGSADAAAVLRGAAAFWGLTPGEEDLRSLAAELGSDVPFCLDGPLMVAEGRGERLRPAPVEASFPLVLAKPPGELAAGEVYERFDADGGGGRGSLGAAADTMMRALESGRPERIGASLANDLEPAAKALCPRTGELIEALLQAGACGAAVCGSGPSVLAVAPSLEAAGDLAEAARALGAWAWHGMAGSQAEPPSAGEG